MENDRIFQWTKLMLDHAWLILPVLAVIYLARRPEFLQRITGFKFGDFELQIAAIQSELRETKEETRRLAETQTRIDGMISAIRIEGSVADLRDSARAVKSQAANLTPDEVADLMKNLDAGAAPAATHAAAVAVRKRADPASLDRLTECLARLSRSSDLAGVRLNTVWMLASAVHLTLVGVYKNGATPVPSRISLQRTIDALTSLSKNPRVLGDRPDDPKKGVMGPVNNALRWARIGSEKVG